MKFEFDIDQVNVILSGLGELPAKLSMDLITSIHKQAENQMQPETKRRIEKNESSYKTLRSNNNN